MSDLFKQRLGTHLTEMVKYLRYVFNDFFVIALLFLIGGLGFAYSNLLKQLHTGLWWPGIVIVVIGLIAQSFNHLATLIEPADRIFLIPQESAMHGYLKAAYRYSVLIAIIPQLLIWFILLPFIRVTMAFNWLELLGLLFTMVILKGADLRNQFNAAYHRSISAKLKWLINLVALTVTLLAPSLGIVISALFIGMTARNERGWQSRSLNWGTLIENEDARMLALYKFFNLFTDVPNIQGTTKRRRYLDFLINRIKPLPQNTYRYLYGHSIVRNGEYSGLHLRLTVIGAVLLVGVGGTYLPILIGMLFLYLIGFQLIPFYFHFTNNVFTHIYPVDTKLQLTSFKQVVAVLLNTSAVIFAIMTLIGSRSIIIGAISLVVNLAECWVLTNHLITNKINQKLD
ncbi:ABC transporter permease [Nicoliella spurrieriana]|uniref:ABC transporter permease n=1 Tax=Nicoliella spurrieriana TaxID=2925830 RepID=A0A976RRU3_9LACO|nr:ABC transporter permease [Nicoliella spurrieriana]UQS86720.1 ABC transporter permease [Nicoliella spurrieriana]